MTPEQERAIRQFVERGGYLTADAAYARICLLLAELDDARAEIARLRAALGPCPRCGGTKRVWGGRTGEQPCPDCGGTGEHPKARTP